MKISNSLAAVAAFVLKKIPTHRNRKRFAKLVGPFFDGAVANTAYGFPMIARWHDNVNRISFEGSYGIVAEFIQTLPKNTLFIDVGANQGCTAILAAKTLAGAGGGVVMAYEPSPTAYELMRKNIVLNNCTNIHTFQQAVAAAKADLFLDEADRGNSGAAHVADTGSPIIAAPVTVSDIRAVGPYDDIYVKIDTEGYEMSVLQGMQELFAAGLIRKLVIEIDDVNLNKFGTDSRQVYEFLSQHGFKNLYNVAGGLTGYSAAGYTKRCTVCQNPHGSRFYSKVEEIKTHFKQ